MASPEEHSEKQDDCSCANEFPRNLGAWFLPEVFARRADVFGAGELQVGEFFDWHRNRGLCRNWRLRNRGLRSNRRLRSRLGWFGGGTLVRRRYARGRGTLRLPHLLSVDLGLTKAGEIVGDGLFVIESEMLCIGADESFVEDSAGKHIEVFFFDGLKHARADLGDVRHVIEREILALARLAKFVSEFAHGPCEANLMISPRMMSGTS